MAIDVVYEKLEQFMITEYLVGHPLASIIAWQRLVKLSINDWQRSYNNYCQKLYNMLTQFHYGCRLGLQNTSTASPQRG